MKDKAPRRRLFESRAAYEKRVAAECAAARAAAQAPAGGGARFYGQGYRDGLAVRAGIDAVDCDRMRARVRNMAMKSTATRSLLRSGVDTAIDSGLVAHACPDREALGITQPEAEAWSKSVDARFDVWAQDRRSVRSERYNFYQMQRMLQLYSDRDGESFVCFSYSPRKDLLNPLQLAVIDPDQINGVGTAGIRWPHSPGFGDGIKLDGDGREMSYSVSYMDGLRYRRQEIPRISGRTGRVFMTHGVAETDYAGQLRGFSPLGVSVQDLDNIFTLSQSKLKKSVNMSQIVAVATGTDPFRNTDDEGVKAVDGVISGREDAKPQAEVMDTEVFDRPGSAIIIRGNGETLAPFGSGGDDEPLKVFVDTFFEYIAAAAGSSPQLVKKSFNGSYHDQRATLILCYRVAQSRRYQMATDHLNAVYEMWLAEEIAAGRVSCPGWSEPRLRSAWARVRFVGTGIPNTEPLREINAIKEQVALGLVTLQEAAEQLGLSTDITSNIERNRPLYEKLKELGFAPWQKGYENSVSGKSGGE